LLLKVRDRKVKFSHDVKAQIMTFSEDKGTRECFLGEFVAEEWGENSQAMTCDCGNEGWEYFCVV